MHAARALNAQRKRRDEKLQIQQQRASSAASRRSASRSPVPSEIDVEAGGGPGSQNKRKKPKSGGADCSYVGFIIAIFGLVPLLVGTFIDVPNLWEIGLGLTIFGLLLGVTFCLWDLCIQHATKDLENSNAAKARSRIRVGGKVEDSSLLKPVDTSVKNGKRSRSGSLASVALPLTGGAAGVPTLTNNYVQKLSPAISESVISEREVTEVKAFREVIENPPVDNKIVSPVPSKDVDNDNTNALSETQVVPDRNEDKVNSTSEDTDDVKVEDDSIVQEEVETPEEEAEKDESVQKSGVEDEVKEEDKAAEEDEVGESETVVDPQEVEEVGEQPTEEVLIGEDPKVDEADEGNEAVVEEEAKVGAIEDLEEVGTNEDTVKEEESSPGIPTSEEATPVDPAEALAKFQKLQEAADKQIPNPDEDQNQNPPPPSMGDEQEQPPNSEKLPEIQPAT